MSPINRTLPLQLAARVHTRRPDHQCARIRHLVRPGEDLQGQAVGLFDLSSEYQRQGVRPQLDALRPAVPGARIRHQRPHLPIHKLIQLHGHRGALPGRGCDHVRRQRRIREQDEPVQGRDARDREDQEGPGRAHGPHQAEPVRRQPCRGQRTLEGGGGGEEAGLLREDQTLLRLQPVAHCQDR